MGLGTRNLNQDVTHWPVSGSDGYGGFTFGTVALLRARWEERSELFIDFDLEEVASKAIAYIPIDVTNGDYMALGDHTTTADPTTLPAASRVRNFGKVTDLAGLDVLRKVWL